MNFDFYLFDVNDGQCAAAKLPNGRWCIFDAGCSADFSPVGYIQRIAQPGHSERTPTYGPRPRISWLCKATISHLHADHLRDIDSLLSVGPQSLTTVEFDETYLQDVRESSSPESLPLIRDFCRKHRGISRRTLFPCLGAAKIKEKWLPLAATRAIGGGANSRVNNASIVSRIDCFGHSILVCGDMETAAWDYVLSRILYALTWKPFVQGIDILVAPHHGHKSGYSTRLMELARPKVVLISVASKDPSVDSRYSGDATIGITIGDRLYKAITTRSVSEHISFSIAPPLSGSVKGARTWDI